MSYDCPYPNKGKGNDKDNGKRRRKVMRKKKKKKRRKPKKSNKNLFDKKTRDQDPIAEHQEWTSNVSDSSDEDEYIASSALHRWISTTITTTNVSDGKR